MATLKQIKASMDHSAEWVANRQALHIKRMAAATQDLQDSIINSLTQISTNKNGSLSSLRLNTQNLKKVHSDIITAFGSEFNEAARTVTNDFMNAEQAILGSYKALDEKAVFTRADRDTMNILKDSAYSEYVAIGGNAQEKVIQSLYSNVLGGKGMADLVTDIQGSLMGAVSVTGRPLVNYAKLYANDMIMNFHNEVTLTKGTKIGMKHFLYYGTVIASSRDFCKRRVGQTYTKKQIDSWKAPWAGKRGSAWTYRGGWNCRHHWQPVRKEWIDKQDPAEMQNWFKEEGMRLPKPVQPWENPSSTPVTPVIPKKATMPTASQVQTQMDKWAKSPEAIKLTKAAEDAKREYDKAGKVYFEANKAAAIKETKANIKLRSETGAAVCDANVARRSANKALKQGRADAFNAMVRPTETSTSPLFAYEETLSKAKATRKTQLKNIANMKKEVEQMFHAKVMDSVNTPIGINFKSKRRAFYQHNTRTIGIGSVKDSRTLVHEFGHTIERYYPGARKAAFDFRKRRVGDEAISVIYKGTTERGWSDKFFSHYCGKDYGSSATEIISMGVEKMYYDPEAFLKKDPDYFEFILKIMWGEI